MKRRHYALIAGLVYVSALIVTVPAELAYRWGVVWAPSIARTLALDGLDGTLWHGHADRLRLGDGIAVQALDWRLRPFDLLRGTIGLAVEGHWQELALSSVVQTPLSSPVPEGRIALRKVRATAALDRPPLAGRLPIQASGHLRIALEEAVVAPMRRPLPIERVTGRITLEGLSIEQAGAGSLGGIELRLESSEAGRITGRFKDDGTGPLALEGEIRIHEDGDRYTLEATAGLRDPNRRDIAQVLRLFGTPGPDGRLRIEHQGRLSHDLATALAVSS